MDFGKLQKAGRIADAFVGVGAVGFREMGSVAMAVIRPAYWERDLIFDFRRNESGTFPDPRT